MARVGGVEGGGEPKRWQELEECRVERNQRGGKSWRSGGWRGTKEVARVGGVEGGGEPKRGQELEECRVERNQRGGKSWRSGE